MNVFRSSQLTAAVEAGASSRPHSVRPAHPALLKRPVHKLPEKNSVKTSGQRSAAWADGKAEARTRAARWVLRAGRRPSEPAMVSLGSRSG